VFPEYIGRFSGLPTQVVGRWWGVGKRGSIRRRKLTDKQVYDIRQMAEVSPADWSLHKKAKHIRVALNLQVTVRTVIDVVSNATHVETS